MIIPRLKARPGFRLGFALIPAACLIALAAICFSKLAADPRALMVDGQRPSLDHANPGGPRPVGNDLTFLFLPHHLYISRAIEQFGHWPMWDPTGFGGRPMVGNPQGGMFYPPVWLVWHWNSPAALGWLTVVHLLWGGLGTYFLARVSGLGRLGATVAGGCFQACPYILGHVFEGHYPHVWGVCWFPWAFWAFDSRRLGRRMGIVTLPLIMATVYVVGHPQEGFLLGLALTFRTFVDWTKSKKHEGVLVRWCGILLVASGIAAIDLVPQIALRNWKLAPAAPSDGMSQIPGHYSLHLINLLQLLTPEALGGPADYEGYDNSWETMLSFGLTPLVLAIAALMLHPEKQAVKGWLLLAGLTLWVAFGYKLGLFALLYHLVPGMNFFRVPARPIFLASLAVAMMAGFGVEALGTGMNLVEDWRRLGRGLIVSAIAFLVFCGLIVGTTHDSSPRISDSPAAETSSAYPDHFQPPRRGWGRERRAIGRVVADPKVWALVLGIGGIVGLGCLKTQRNDRRLPTCAIGLLAFVELGFWGHSLLRVSSPDAFLGPDPVAEAICRSTTPGQPPPRLKARDTFYSDLRTISNGLEKTNIDDSFQLRHAAALYQQLYPVASRPEPNRPEAPMDRAVEEYGRVVRQGVFDRMAVGFLVSNRAETDPDWPTLKAGPWDERSGYVVQRNPTALPRAYVVGRAEVVEADPARILSGFRTTDPRELVLMLTDPLAGLPSSASDRQPFTPATWTSADPDHQGLEVTTAKPGLLVVADTWMPGWSALVDGKPVAIHRGNIAQRVIPLLEPGTHTIRLDYTPPGLYLGFGMFVGTLGIWGLVCSTTLRRAATSPLHLSSDVDKSE